MAPGWQQLLIVLVLVLVLFGGRGRISSLMGDMAKGIKSFRSGLKDDDQAEAQAEAARLQAAEDKGSVIVEPAPDKTKA
jgi:sec-independent protein translocase protein TatA